MKRIRKTLFGIIIYMILVMPVCETNITDNLSTVNAASKIAINKKKATLYVGKNLSLKVNGTNKKVKWSSNKKSVATVSSRGKVTAKKAGKATVTAKIGKKKYKCVITVNSIFGKNPKTVTVEDFKKVYIMTNLDDVLLSSTVSDPEIIKAQWDTGWGGKKTGLNITALKDGTSTITIKNNVNSEKIKINVIAEKEKLTSQCNLIFDKEFLISYDNNTPICKISDIKYKFTKSIYDPTKVDLEITYMVKSYINSNIYYRAKLKTAEENIVVMLENLRVSDLKTGESIQQSRKYVKLEPGSYVFSLENYL